MQKIATLMWRYFYVVGIVGGCSMIPRHHIENYYRNIYIFSRWKTRALTRVLSAVKTCTRKELACDFCCLMLPHHRNSFWSSFLRMMEWKQNKQLILILPHHDWSWRWCYPLMAGAIRLLTTHAMQECNLLFSGWSLGD
jgi:hypothetical protein